MWSTFFDATIEAYVLYGSTYTNAMPKHLLFLLLWLLPCHSLQPTYTLKVCQHKTCTKQHNSINRPLLQIVRDLIPPETLGIISIEPSGCLSQCGLGPNIVVRTKSTSEEQEKLYNGVDSPQAAVVILDVACGIKVSPILIAACDVMSKAEQGKF